MFIVDVDKAQDHVIGTVDDGEVSTAGFAGMSRNYTNKIQLTKY